MQTALRSSCRDPIGVSRGVNQRRSHHRTLAVLPQKLYCRSVIDPNHLFMGQPNRGRSSTTGMVLTPQTAAKNAFGQGSSRWWPFGSYEMPATIVVVYHSGRVCREAFGGDEWNL